jgi:hypothetical protein
VQGPENRSTLGIVSRVTSAAAWPLARHSGRGKTSGLDVGQTGGGGASLFEIRDGRVIKLVSYWDRAYALADLGLER